MARGWESKSIESQQQDARAKTAVAREAVSAARRSALDRRKTLELARARTVADLRACTSKVHRTMLEHALRAIDDQLQRLG